MRYDSGVRGHAIQHRERVEATLARSGAGSAIEQGIRRSWRRCLEDHSLDPARHRKPPIVDSAELRRRRASADAAYPIVHAQMLRISRTFTHAAGIVFTDTDGVILSYMGESTFAAHAHRAGLRVGAVWSESEQGTNGMGTCLIEREPVVIEQHAHFLAQNTGLSCFAAPVLDRRGVLVGALDISSLCALPRESMLALLDLAVTDIERRLLLRQSAGQHLLYFGPRRAYVGTTLEGILSFDDSGLITGANRAAIGWLDMSAHAEICGKPLASVLGIDADCVAMIGGSFRCRSAVATEDHASFHCHISAARTSRAQPPTETKQTAVRAAVAAAERAVLAEALRAHDWNITRAARSLGIGRKTLYRKIRKHRLDGAPAEVSHN